MDAKQVLAYAFAKWPEAMNSPLAKTCRAVVTAELQESERGTEYADAMDYALEVIDRCNEEGVEYDGDTLSATISGEFPELSGVDCDNIADAAIAKGAK